MVAEDETEYYENGSDSDEKANEMVGVERKISREVFLNIFVFRISHCVSCVLHEIQI